MEVLLTLEPEVVLFYTRIAAASGKTLIQVVQDALFLLAGELSMEAIHKMQMEKSPDS